MKLDSLLFGTETPINTTYSLLLSVYTKLFAIALALGKPKIFSDAH